MRAIKVIPIVILFLLLAGYLLGFRFNTSNSIPIGLYRMISPPVSVGDYVIFCPPQSDIVKTAQDRGYIEAGFCPGGFGALMKKVMAVAGDIVSSNVFGVSVNGYYLPFSQPHTTDAAGQTLTFWECDHCLLKSHELLLMTDQSPFSFDARYFGLVTTARVQGVIEPIWILPLNTTNFNQPIRGINP